MLQDKAAGAEGGMTSFEGLGKVLKKREAASSKVPLRPALLGLLKAMPGKSADLARHTAGPSLNLKQAFGSSSFIHRQPHT